MCRTIPLAARNSLFVEWTRQQRSAFPARTAARAPFWSPDNKAVGFFSAGHLLRYTLGDGGPTPVATIGGSPSGAVWMANGDIVLSRGDGPLFKVSSLGGTPVRITTLDSTRGELHQVRPDRLLDGRHFLFTAISYRGEYRGGRLFVGSVDGGPSKFIMAGCEAGCTYVAPNHILVQRGADVKAITIDPKSFRVGSEETTVLSGAPVPLIVASQTGTIVWLDETSNVRSSIELLDRGGSTKRVIGSPEDGGTHQYWAPRISPDGHFAAAEHHLGQGGGDIYMFDLATGAQRRETFDATNPQRLRRLQSPDGKRIGPSIPHPRWRR